MIITFHFDVLVGVGRGENLIKRFITINTGINKPSEQYMYNAMDKVLSDISISYGPGVSVQIIPTKTIYNLITKK